MQASPHKAAGDHTNSTNGNGPYGASNRTVAVSLDDEALAALLADFAKVSEAITADFIVDEEAREAWEWTHAFHGRYHQSPSPQALKEKFAGVTTTVLVDPVEYVIEKLEDRRERNLRTDRERKLASIRR